MSNGELIQRPGFVLLTILGLFYPNLTLVILNILVFGYNIIVVRPLTVTERHMPVIASK